MESRDPSISPRLENTQSFAFSEFDEQVAPTMTIMEVESKHVGQDAAQREKVSTWDFPTMRTPSQSPGKGPAFHQDEVISPRGSRPNIRAWDAKHGDQDAAQNEKGSIWDFPTMCMPSQWPGKWWDFHQDEVMTPGGHGPNISAWDVDGSFKQVTPAHWQEAVQEPVCAPPKTNEDRQTTPPYTPRAKVSLLLSEILWGSGDQLQCANAISMGEQRFCESFAAAAAAAQMEATAQCSEQQGHTMPACPWSDGHCRKHPKPLVSMGSVGHPSSCNEACKFAKKKRGCKDGASCDHCHLCDWKRHKSGRAACRVAARLKWESL